MSDPPYLRIVADIRRRIADAELRAGDPVPSAREIHRQWGVAIATATKVHAALRRDGLTRAVPGVGTVVAGPPAPTARRSPSPGGAPPGEPVSAHGDRPRPPAADIDRARIVRTAVHIADTEGLAEVSMRRIAAELGVATMSLYRHLPGKEDLVLHMVDAVLAERDRPGPRGDRRARLMHLGRTVWQVFRRHPWLAPAMSLTRPQLSPHTLSIADDVLGALAGTRLSPHEQMHVHLSLFSFIRGVAAGLDLEAEARRETGLTSDEWMQAQQARLGELLPPQSPLHTVLRSGFDLDVDALVEFGLARLLDGLHPQLNAGPARR
ncbi:TetR/AcrR family transcriptional regulator C-terminal domain-containing protein [Krasilnikovia sp. MM14-A1259]|uniref:TetR/AcrR family transcriptional regulator C-terminal domain-containing protein n=1 Tax=Krasilnikovia sp. MM14-A1259 TaxID=3373539 RepID=UPI003814B9B3